MLVGYFTLCTEKPFIIFFSGIFIGIIFHEKSIKIRLFINVQTVHRQMISPQEEENRIRTVCGVELAAIESHRNLNWL